jgi:hypothetical protein
MKENSPLHFIVTKQHWLKRDLQIFEGSRQIGKIEFKNRLRLDAMATILDERWKITQSGFWKTSLHFSASGEPFAKIKVQLTFGGELEWKGSDGKTYIFRRIKWWKNTWAWYDENKNAVIEIRPDHSFSIRQAHITINNKNLTDFRLMTLIGICIFKIQKARAAAAAT